MILIPNVMSAENTYDAKNYENTRYHRPHPLVPIRPLDSLVAIRYRSLVTAYAKEKIPHQCMDDLPNLRR